jgi:RNA recognition motif-containing protein
LYEVCTKEIYLSTNIYIGNLPFNVTVEEIQELFGHYGAVEKVNLITDRETGRPRGFGFVEMASGAHEAIAALNDKNLNGRNLRVNLAKPREERRPSRW